MQLSVCYLSLPPGGRPWSLSPGGATRSLLPVEDSKERTALQEPFFQWPFLKHGCLLHCCVVLGRSKMSQLLSNMVLPFGSWQDTTRSCVPPPHVCAHCKTKDKLRKYKSSSHQTFFRDHHLTKIAKEVKKEEGVMFTKCTFKATPAEGHTTPGSKLEIHV